MFVKVLLLTLIVGVFSPEPTPCERELVLLKEELAFIGNELNVTRLSLEVAETQILDLEAKVDVAEQKNADLTKALYKLQGDYDDLFERFKLISEPSGFDMFAYFCVFLVCVWLIWWLLPLLISVAKWIGGRFTLCWWYIRTLPRRVWTSRQSDIGEYIDMTEYTPEAMLEGSPLQPIETGDYAHCVFKIYRPDRVNKNCLSFLGHGFWADMGDLKTQGEKYGTFLTCSHNVLSRGDLVLMNANDSTKTLVVPESKWSHFDDYDVAYFTPTQKETTTLGIRKARVPDTRLKGKVVVKAYGKMHQTLGSLSLADDSQFVNYEGTSVGGFSGSPYVSNNAVFGIHIGSSQKCGLGLDAGFLKLKFAAMRRLVRESSESWIEDEVAKALSGGKKIRWKSYGLDDVLLNIRGQDFLFDRGDFMNVRNQHEDGFREVERFEAESFVDVESPPVGVESIPKNFQSPAPVLVSGVPIVESVVNQVNPKLRKLYGSIGTQTQSTLGQQLTPAQSKEASKDTLTSIVKALDVLNNQVKKLEQKLSNASQSPQEKSGRKKQQKEK